MVSSRNGEYFVCAAKQELEGNQDTYISHVSRVLEHTKALVGTDWGGLTVPQVNNAKLYVVMPD